ncbi:MAG: hypothetical protein GWN58_54580 [Anaerolineae bacterium]|nr:hypothetical protein [Anaerolineae bacterium]
MTDFDQASIPGWFDRLSTVQNDESEVDRRQVIATARNTKFGAMCQLLDERSMARALLRQVLEDSHWLGYVDPQTLNAIERELN